MAHFYGEMQGCRQSVSRTGTKNSGFEAHIRGWEVGVQVDLTHVDGRDIISVYQTGGSNGGTKKLVAQFSDLDGSIV